MCRSNIWDSANIQYEAGSEMVLGLKHHSQVDRVGVQVHADNIRRGVIKVKVARVHTHYKWTRSVEYVC